MIGNQRLRKAFDFLNDRFFNSRIPGNTIVKFARIPDDGQCHMDDGSAVILIDRSLQKHPDLATVVLIHEMIHADLRHAGYIGYSAEHCHDIMFYAAQHKLYLAGIYEGLL
jgi:hypothetical protein